MSILLFLFIIIIFMTLFFLSFIFHDSSTITFYNTGKSISCFLNSFCINNIIHQFTFIAKLSDLREPVRSVTVSISFKRNSLTFAVWNVLVQSHWAEKQVVCSVFLLAREPSIVMTYKTHWVSLVSMTTRLSFPVQLDLNLEHSCLIIVSSSREIGSLGCLLILDSVTFQCWILQLNLFANERSN